MDYEAPNVKETNKKAESIYFKVPRLTEETVRAEMWDFKYFYDPIHYHEECQITIMLESEGYCSSVTS